LKRDDLIERSKEVGLILSELSRCHLDGKGLKEYAERFSNIYRDGYRQRYSEILEMLKGIPSDDDTDGQDDEAEDRLEVLSANLVDLREYLGCNVEIYGEPVHSGVFKLSDHVDIEICRIRDRDNIFHELSRTGDDLDSLSKQAAELKKDLSEARDKADRLQMHTVAILGIFAAIVMAFAGGLDILSGAISVSGESDLFKVVFVVLLCGMVLFNIFGDGSEIQEGEAIRLAGQIRRKQVHNSVQCCSSDGDGRRCDPHDCIGMIVDRGNPTSPPVRYPCYVQHVSVACRH